MCGEANQKGTEVHFFLKVTSQSVTDEEYQEVLAIHLGDQLRLVLGFKKVLLYRKTTVILEVRILHSIVIQTDVLWKISLLG